MLQRLFSLAHAAMRSMGYTEQVMAARAPGIPNTSSKIAVTEHTAIRYAAVYACIRCISETKGSLPMEVIETNKSGKIAVSKLHPVSQLLEFEPYEDMTPPVWSEVRQADVLTGGTGYTEIVWNVRDFTIQALIPRHWSLVTPRRDADGHLVYEVRESAGSSNIRVLDRSQMMVIPGFGNGIVGWNSIRLLAEAIGIGLAQDKFTGCYFGNSAKPSIVLESELPLGDEVFARLKGEVETQYSNDNAHRPMLLEQVKAKAITINANEAQLQEAREYQEEVICRIFRVPPHMIGLLRRATFSNIEAQDLSYEKHTIRPWLVRDEAEMNRKLFPRSEWGRFRVRHNVDDLLRADIKTRYEAYKTAILAGIKSRNEVRELENLAPREGCDELLLPEAIFGKSQGKDSSKKKPAQGDGEQQNSKRRRRADPRLHGLLTQTIAGLISREITHVERAVAKPEQFREQIVALYEKQVDLISEKLAIAGVVEPAKRAATAHRDELLALADSSNLAADVATLTSTWGSAASDLANSIIK